MRFEVVRRGRARRAWIAILLAFALVPTPVIAQAPSAEQMQLLESLPKEQRDQILQQMGGGTGASPAGRSGRNEIIVTQPPRAADSDEDSGAGPSASVLPPDRPIRGDELLLLHLALDTDAATETITQITPDGREVARETITGGAAARSADDQQRLVAFRDRVLRRNPYQLTRFGVLQLPGLEPIPLAGLTAREAQERLALDPALRDFTVSVRLLRLQPQGRRALKPFGYDMLKSGSTAFVPGTDIPAPEDYVIGPGDTMDVQLYGQRAVTYSLPVNRDGFISVPEVGPIGVGGLGAGAARTLVEGRIRRQLVGTQARVTLSELRSVRVLVLGDAEKPGSYVVSSLSTVTNALFASGGVKPIGSLRRIEVKRAGKLLGTLDLYDVLLNGDTADDVRLQPGDAVFIPPVGPTVAIDGEVRRPAIYELDGESTAAQLVDLAGGLTPESDERRVTVERIDESRDRIALTIDLTTPAGRAFTLRSGDLLRITPIRPVLENGVRVEGYVHRPGTYAWREGMRLSDLLTSVDELKPQADIRYVLVRREDPTTRRVSAVSADLAAALAARGTTADVPLAPRDVVFVFDQTSPRERIIAPLLDELSRQAGPAAPAALVTIGGRVNAPGRYPLEPGMRVSDLVRAGGGLEDAAYATGADLTRYYVLSGERRRADLQDVDLAAVTAGNGDADLVLQPYDVLTIREMPEWGRVEQVEIAGEVRFPGRYQIRRGETLSSLVERAGGLSPLAFPEGAVLTREELKQREAEQLARLASRLQADIAVLSLQASQTNPAAVQALSAGQGLLEQLRSTRPVGRLVIDLDGVVGKRDARVADVMLRDGDRLFVPRLAQEISVLGEVQNSTSHLYQAGLTRDDVIERSGGVSARADRKRTYVVRADGSVLANSSRWFGGGDVELHPGDTVVVPLDAEKMRPLPLWTAVTTIVYNLAIAAAAVATF